MLILIGIVPGVYAVNLAAPADTVSAIVAQSHSVAAIIQKQSTAPAADAASASTTLGAYLKSGGAFTPAVLPALAEKNKEIDAFLAGRKTIADIPEAQRSALRTAFYYTSETIAKLNKTKKIRTRPTPRLSGTISSG